MLALGLATLAPAATATSAPTVPPEPSASLPEPSASSLIAPQGNMVPDQVFVYRKRRGEIEIVSQSGVVTKNDLSGVEVENGSKTDKLDAAEVQRIVFGDSPPSYRDGLTFFARGDYENAAARFQVAATDAGARAPVQAAARLAAGTSFLKWGAVDPVHFASASEQFTTFFVEHPQNRELPQAEQLHARALFCAGDATLSGATYRSVFEQLAGTEAAEGYRVSDCLDSGLRAAKAMLAAKDTLAARELLDELERALDAVIAGMGADGDADKDEVAHLEAMRGEARIARDGFAELVGDNLQAAKNFFENQYAKVSATDAAAVRFSVVLGLAGVRLQEGKLREAELLFAQVAALDYSDRDRIAQALLGQAQAAKAIADSDSAARSKSLLVSVIEEYGDTPSAKAARALVPDYEAPTEDPD